MLIRARIVSNWGWVVVFTSWILFVVLYGIMYSYGLLFVQFQQEFRSSATLTGWAGAIPIALTILLAPPMQVIIDRFGYRAVGVVSLVLASAGVVATSFVPNILVVYVTYSLMYGCGSGGLTLVCFGLISQYFPSKNYVRALALALSGSSLGMLSFAPLITFLFDRLGWRNTLRVLGSLFFTVCMPCVATFTPPTLDITPSTRDPEQDKECSQSEAVHSSTDAHDDAYLYSSTKYSLEHCIDDAKTRSPSEECNHEDAMLNRNATGDIIASGVRLLKKDQEETLNSKMLLDDSKNSTLGQRLYQAMTYPELWIISVAVIIIGVLDCFFYVNMVSYMVSVGFTEADGARVLSIMGTTTFVAKLSLSFGGELLPFPPYYLLVITSLVSSVVMCSFLFVSSLVPMYFLAAVIGGLILTTNGTVLVSLPNSFFGPKRARQTMPVIYFCNGVGLMCGSVVGQSIDRTGSYRSAILVSIGVYIFITLLFIAAPIYQRAFAPDRYVVQELYRLNRSKNLKVGDREGSCKIVDVFEASGTKLEITYERVSSV